MKQAELKRRQKHIKSYFEKDEEEIGHEEAKGLIQELFKEEDFSHICEVYQWSFLKPKKRLYLFEVAYSLHETDSQDDAEEIYEYLQTVDPNNPAILNNLSNIKKSKGQIGSAWELICQAYELNPDDKTVAGNHETLSSIVQERRQVDEHFKAALSRLEGENEWVLRRLKEFLGNLSGESEYRDRQLPIPKWKFRILMRTDQPKADSLAEQWLERGYIRRTGERGGHGEHVYEINPYLEEGVKLVESLKYPSNWISGIESVNRERLTQLTYFDVVGQLTYTSEPCRRLLQRDVNELFFNYLAKNAKSVVVLAGSIVETLLINHCHEKNVQKISFSRGEKNLHKNLYDADLGDLLDYFQAKRLFGDLTIHMGNISRISRNFIHPGKELRDTDELSWRKAEICFHSTLEILRTVCQPVF